MYGASPTYYPPSLAYQQQLQEKRKQQEKRKPILLSEPKYPQHQQHPNHNQLGESSCSPQYMYMTNQIGQPVLLQIQQQQIQQPLFYNHYSPPLHSPQPYYYHQPAATTTATFPRPAVPSRQGGFGGPLPRQRRGPYFSDNAGTAPPHQYHYVSPPLVSPSPLPPYSHPYSYPHHPQHPQQYLHNNPSPLYPSPNYHNHARAINGASQKKSFNNTHGTMHLTQYPNQTPDQRLPFPPQHFQNASHPYSHPPHPPSPSPSPSSSMNDHSCNGGDSGVRSDSGVESEGDGESEGNAYCEKNVNMGREHPASLGKSSQLVRIPDEEKSQIDDEKEDEVEVEEEDEEDSRSLNDDNVNPPFKLIVKTLTGRSMSIVVRQNTSLRQLKKQIEAMYAIPTHSQHLLFPGKTSYKDSMTLGECNISLPIPIPIPILANHNHSDIGSRETETETGKEREGEEKALPVASQTLHLIVRTSSMATPTR